jgi:inorganic pyrophosphatase
MDSFEVEAVVEISFGSMYKYEVDKKTGQLVIDRPLSSPLPYNYGYVPNTLHEDGDALDVCIIGENPIYPLTKLKVILMGAFKCIDNGESDDKLVAVIVGEGVTDKYMNYAKQTVTNYLSTYKSGFEVLGFVGPEEAYQIVMKDTEAYLNE